MALLFLLGSCPSARAERTEICAKPLQAERLAKDFDSPEQQIEYIRIFQTSSGRKKEAALQSLYANYHEMIEGMARKNAKTLRRHLPGNFDDYLENFRQVGVTAFTEAINNYKLQYPKPAIYIRQYVYFKMLELIITRDGQMIPPGIVRKKMNNAQRRLLFSGQLEALYQSMEGRVSMAKLKEFHDLYSKRFVYLNEPVALGSSEERIASLPDLNCQLLNHLREGPIQEIVNQAKNKVRALLSDRDREIADARVFCEAEDAKVMRKMEDSIGISHEGIRQIANKIRAQLKTAIEELLINPEDFMKELTSEESTIARQRLFAIKKTKPHLVARSLGQPEEYVVEIEKRISERYRYAVKNALLEMLQEAL